jgi:hypothetical protein
MAQIATHRPSHPTGLGEVIEREFIRVVFQSGFPREVGINGCRVEDVIALAVDRLNGYQNGTLACPENESALNSLNMAIKVLEERIKRRQQQGVLNTMSRHEIFRTEDLDADFSATGA